MHPLRTAVPADWVRGIDISNCWEIEQYGGKYKNFDNQVEDIMKILVDAGINYVRIRLWVDPEALSVHYPGDGNNKMAVTKVIAARAKAAGLKILLDYHYSDYWADPGQQYVPISWTGTNANGLYDNLVDYTTNTLNELIAANAKPDMVQLGNEIRSGLLNKRRSGTAASSGGYTDTRTSVLSGWAQFSTALSRAANAVRAVDPNIKIMIQFDQGGDSGILSTYANFTRRIDNNSGPTNTLVDYDIIGLSWYTYWSSHGSLDALYDNIRAFKTRFGKQVMVCESGFGFNFGTDYDYPLSTWQVRLNANFIEDLRNVYGVKNTGMEGLGGTRTTNGQNNNVNSGLAASFSSLAGSEEMQARAYRSFMDIVLAAGGDGVMWWGGDWFAPIKGLNSNVENSAVFDTTGKALPVLRVLGGIKGTGTKPGKMTGVSAASASNTSIAISWPRVSQNIAGMYYVERSANGTSDWSQVGTVTGSNTIGTASYTNTGLTQGTRYYYRVRAGNGTNNATYGSYSDVVNATAGGGGGGTPTGEPSAWLLATGLRQGTGSTATEWADQVAAQKFTLRAADGILELAVNQTAQCWFIFHVIIPDGYSNPGNTFWQAASNNVAFSTTAWVTPAAFNATEVQSRSYTWAAATRSGKFEINPNTRQVRWVSN
jgi:arabinogalactan endo-1,4-beta-galactosidase